VLYKFSLSLSLKYKREDYQNSSVLAVLFCNYAQLSEQ